MSEFNYGIILGTLVHRARGYKRFRNEVIMSSHRKYSAMEATENREYGIVMKNVVVYSKRKIPSTLIGGTSVVIHSLGECAMVSKAVDNSRSYFEEVYRCPLDALVILERSAWDVIVAVPAPEDRKLIIQDKQLFTELLSIDEGSIVKVVTTSMEGIVTNKTFLPDLGPGLYFEVELFDDKTDSVSRNSRRDAYGNYYPVSALRPMEPMCPSKKSRGSYVTPKAKNDFSIFDKLSPSDTNRKEDHFTNNSKSTKINRFNRGDRVVWKSAAGETKNAMICSRSQLGGSKLQVHLGSDCREVSCDRSRTQNIPITEVLTEDEYKESRNNTLTIATQPKNDVYVEDLLGIDQLDNCSPMIPTYASVLKDYGGEEEEKNQSNVLRKCESRQSLDEDLTNLDDLGIGSMVQISIGGEPHYGVIKFIGPISYGNRVPNQIVAGIELEEESRKHGDGHLYGVKYFDCAPNRGTFTLLSQCRKDSRFQDSPLPSADETRAPEDFGKAVIPGVVEPIKQLENMHLLCGKYKGIQGHNNSCYLDATLFSMFIFTSVFDDLLYRPPNDADIQQYEEVQRVLREEIVNPLRKNLYVRSDRVMKLRTLLDNLTSVTGLTCEEKDPEEFLTSLVAQVLKAEPYLKLSSDHEAYYYQLFVEKDERLKLPTVQQLFQQSFITSDIKLKEVPSRLIIQMPRFGKSYKMYPRILPSQILDVTDVIENTPRVCSLCAELAHYECKECFKDEEFEECFSFCSNCVKKFHSHERRTHHKYTRITIPREFDKSTNYKSMPRHFMELFAVLCIETSHYVAFVKCGLGPDTPWCFFDSMADREGGSSGHNIPEMVLCPDLPSWLSDAGAKFFCEMPDDRHLDPYAKRLLCDAYMCLYQSTDVMMYR